MRKIWEILKEHWNLYSPFIISSIASWLVDWNANQMVTINQWVGITLSFMALFTMIKFIIFPKKKKNAVEKLVSTQKVVKSAEMIINQEENDIKTQKLTKRIMKGGKKIMNWIKKNKGAIISWVVFVVSLLETIFNWVGQFLPFSIGFNIVGITFAFVSLIVATLTTGFGSTKFKEAVAQVKDQLNGDTTELDEINSIKYLERQIMTYEKAILTIEKNAAGLEKKYASTIADFKTCQQLGLTPDEDVKNEFINFQKERQDLQNKLNSKTSALQLYKSKLEQLKKSIENKQ